ncbi:MAG: hypothetical protein JRH20_22145 [Deltaproteobacteria bacterium]|nr:hypothetical protein [Deltaproteobacteria bacterium]
MRLADAAEGDKTTSDAEGGRDAEAFDAREEGAPSRAPCLSKDDCDLDHPICTWPAGSCVAATVPYCGLPPAPRGATEIRSLGETCSVPKSVPSFCPEGGCGCDVGLVCVSSRWLTQTNTKDYQVTDGQCFEACDPCASATTCIQGRGCYALADGGGFCHPSPLPELGEVSPLGICAQPAAAETPVMGGRCAYLCRPEASSSEFFFVSTSPDCPSGELCTSSGMFMPEGFRSSICVEGSFVAWGTLCKDEPNKYCPLPCQPIGSPKICSPDCQSEPCPDGLGCFPIYTGGQVLNLCVGDGVIPYHGLCAEDRNCLGGMRCRPGNEEVPYAKSCLL